MKFSALTLFAVAVATLPFHMAEAKMTSRVRNRGAGDEPTDERNKVGGARASRILKGTGEDGGGKGGKGGSLGFCDDCATRLPGFNFWGQSYLADDFYKTFFSKTKVKINPVNDYPTNTPGFAPEAYLTLTEKDFSLAEFINEFGFCWGFVTGDEEATFGCLVLTILTELIFDSETLRCLLTSLSKTSRDTLCFLADIYGVPNPDILGIPIDNPIRKLAENPAVNRVMERRQLNPSSSSGGLQQTGDNMLDLLTMAASLSGGGTGRKLEGADGNGSILDMFGITSDDVMAKLRAKMGCATNDCSAMEAKMKAMTPPDRDRELQQGFDIRGIIKLVANFIDFIAQSDPAFRVGVAVLDFFWFEKCLDAYGTSLPNPNPFALISCGVLYSLEKTEDAIICEDSAKCDIATECTANQKFDTEYTSRRIARALPSSIGSDTLDGFWNFLIADVLAPCGCADTCAAFCWYQENFHQCDDYKRSFLYAYGEEGFNGEDAQIALEEFYNAQLPFILLELFGIDL